MQKVKNILNEIKNTNSRIEKENILYKNKDNILLKEILCFVFSPYVLTGLSKKKISKMLQLPKEESTLSIVEVMDYLKTHNSGRDEDIRLVQHFIKSQPETMQEFYTKVVTKDIKAGITADTINKVYGEDFIKTFDVMLAKKYEDHKHKIKGDFVITKKLDGNRLICIKENGIVKSFTRQGNQYNGLEEIESDIVSIMYDNIVFDGELIADTKGNTLDIYAETTSKARKKDKNKTGLLFHIFDMLPLEDFQYGKSDTNCIDRKMRLSDFFNNFDLPHCREVEPLYIGSDLSQIDKCLSYAQEQGWEGIMVNMDTPYVNKRTDTLLKVKVMSTCDLKVIGFEEGINKYKGMLGSLIVDYKGFSLGVGSGFTDVERKYIWSNKEIYLGRVVEVQYFEESKNQQGELSLRFPVFKGVRELGKEVSYN